MAEFVIYDNKTNLLYKLTDFFNQIALVKITGRVFKPIKAVDENGQLIYSTGNRINMKVYAGQQYMMQIKTVDQFNHNCVWTRKEKPQHMLSIWLNPTCSISNVSLYTLHYHKRGFMSCDGNIKELEQLIRYTTAPLEINSKLFTQAVQAKFEHNVVNLFEEE